MKVSILEDHEVNYWDSESESIVFSPKSSYYIINSLGQYVFYHTRSREEAQKQADADWGYGKYKIRTAKESKGSGDYTCTGSNSRKGFASHLKKTI